MNIHRMVTWLDLRTSCAMVKAIDNNLQVYQAVLSLLRCSSIVLKLPVLIQHSYNVLTDNLLDLLPRRCLSTRSQLLRGFKILLYLTYRLYIYFCLCLYAFPLCWSFPRFSWLCLVDPFHTLPEQRCRPQNNRYVVEITESCSDAAEATIRQTCES